MRIASNRSEGILTAVHKEKSPLAPSEARSTKMSMTARIRNAFSSKSEGGALVEMAVTMPLLLLIMTGIFVFAIALYQKLELAEAVAAGGRFLAVDRGDHDPCATTATKVQAAAPTLGTITLTFSLNGGTATGPTCPGSGTTGQNTNMISGKNAQITGSYTCTLKAYNYTYPGCSLATTITEVVQ